MTERLSPERAEEISENWKRICENVAEAEEAAKRAGRFSSPVRIVAATKKVGPEDIRCACEAGLRELGENRVQEFASKFYSYPEEAEKHFIGRLQTNKVRTIVGRVSLIQSVDSLHLAAEIGKRAQMLGMAQDVLIELNIGREADKGGVLPEQIGAFLENAAEIGGISVVGMMVIGPVCRDEEEQKKIFDESYQIFIDNFVNTRHNSIRGKILSMGMSGSYRTAIACGANMIRPGSALFGPRS